MTPPIDARQASTLGKVLIALHQYASQNSRVEIISRHLAQSLAAHAPGDRQLRCLDVGCGDMRLAELLAKALPATSWVCLDVYDLPAGLAGQERWTKYQRFDGKALSFADGEFDVVIFSDVLHHAEDNAASLLAEAARVGGLVLVKDHFEYSLWSRYWLWLMDVFGNWSYGVPLPKRYYTPDSFAQILADTGLRVRHMAVGLNLYGHIPLARTLLREEWQFLAILEPKSRQQRPQRHAYTSHRSASRMKALDKILRRWRMKAALREAPVPLSAAFDIGCHDGFLLGELGPETTRRDGCDPELACAATTEAQRLVPGHFPDALGDSFQDGSYDAIFALAVLEHFSEEHLRNSAAVLAKMLAPGGRFIATVPHPFVDKILRVLVSLRLLEGTDFENHHGFDPDQLAGYFSKDLTLLKRKKFQLGLNNCFVFVKRQ